MTNTPGNFTIAIESAIHGGSLSLRAHGQEIDRWSGDGNVSRAEDLLPNIVRMLRGAGGGPESLGSIAVAVGPGSYTGIRIGIATALGLKNSLAIACVGVSTLKAMALSVSRPMITAAVPVGRDLICSQDFVDGNAISEPKVGKSLDLAPRSYLIVHPSIGHVAELLPNVEVEVTTSELATLIGIAAENGHGDPDLRPIFVNPAV